MNIDFERTRLEIAGEAVTVTVWYETDKQRYRANAPSLTHLLRQGETEEGSTGATREEALKALQELLTKRWEDIKTKREGKKTAP